MDVAGFYYLEGSLLFGFVVAAGLTVVSLNRPDYRVARRCAWAAAILFGSIAVVWGVTTTEPGWIRIPAVGIVGLIAAISLSEALRFIKNREFPNPPVAEATVQRGPTLEATGHSSIDATGAEIPADLPFQLGRAADHSRIDMPGLKITPQPDGSLKIIPGETSLQFPSEEYANLTVAQIKERINAISGELLIFENQFESEFWPAARENPSDYKPAAAVREKYEAIFQEKFLKTAQSLTSACLLKTGGRFDSSNLSNVVQHGAITIRNGHFASHSPGKDVAAFLQAISATLPRS